MTVKNKFFAFNGNVSTGAAIVNTIRASAISGSEGDGAWSATLAASNSKMAFDGTASNLRIQVGFNNATLDDCISAFTINEAATALSITITAGDTGTFSNLTDVVPFTTSQNIAYKHTTLNTGAGGWGRCGLSLEITY